MYYGELFVFAGIVVLLFWFIASLCKQTFKVNHKFKNGLELIEYCSGFSLTHYFHQYVQGKIRNTTKTPCSVALTIQLFDKHKNTIYSLNDFIQILKPNEIWSFKTISQYLFIVIRSMLRECSWL